MNYNQMKKEELIKTLKERDAVIAGFEETNATLVKENDDLAIKIKGLTRDCEGMTEECNNLHNKINGLTDDLKNQKQLADELKASLSAKQKQTAALEVKLEAVSIEKSIALNKKRLYIATIVLLAIGVVVLAIL